MKSRTAASIIGFLLIISSFTAGAWARDMVEQAKGQTIYVPAYSHIYSGNNERPFYLAITASIRNIDAHESITITAVDYYDSQGKKLKKFLSSPAVLKPLASLDYVIPESHKEGGSGASFIITWQSDKPVNPPIAEAVMIGTQFQQGVSFTSRGLVINEID